MAPPAGPQPLLGSLDGLDLGQEEVVFPLVCHEGLWSGLQGSASLLEPLWGQCCR